MIGPLSGKGPLYRQVYSAIREAILSGEMPSGTLLPATRELVQVLHISRTTILNAYAELVAEGYATGRVGSGTYVNGHIPQRILQAPVSRQRNPSTHPKSERNPVSTPTSISTARAKILPRLPFCDFQFDQLSREDFPFRVWYQLIAKHAPADFKQSSAPEGSLTLREAIAAHLVASRGVVCDAQQIIIVNGTQQCLDLAARVMLYANDTVAIEEAHYPGAREVFQSAGARILPVSLDADGMRVKELADNSKKAVIRLVYVTPSHQMPTGATMSVVRRTQLIEWAARNDAYIVEDDYDGEYRYDGLSLPSLQGLSHGERVIYIGSFSRSISPTIRIGYLVAPPSLVGKFRDAKWLADRHSPLLIQEALAEFIGEGHFERYLRRARGRNYRRRAALLDAFAEHFRDSVEILGGDAGVHVLARFRDEASLDLSLLISRASAVGVGVYPVTPYFIRPVRRCELLLGYGALREEQIKEGIHLLRSVFLDSAMQPPLARIVRGSARATDSVASAVRPHAHLIPGGVIHSL